jgi:arylformamidase
VHDLRPLLRLALNADLRLDAEEAAAESPALLAPRQGVRVHAWVGDAERPEFVRQTTLIANIWTGLRAEMSQTIAAGRHHFDVIAPLTDPDSDLVEALIG